MTPDGAAVLTGDNDDRIRVWDARDGRLLRTLAGHGGAVELLAVSPDGRTLASYAQDMQVKLWSLPTGRELMTMPGRDLLRGLFFTPDGMGVAVANIWVGASVLRANAVK
jgi:WD40 repeat protein